MGVVEMNQVGGDERVLPADGDQVTPGISAGDAYGGGGGVRPVEAELDHLGARDQVDDPLGRLALEPVRTVKLTPAASQRRAASVTGSNP